MKNKLFWIKAGLTFLAIAIVIGAYLSIETDYDKQMKPIMKLKLAEQRAGKPSPVFDGEVEPPFPDLDKNDETLEGIDSNHNRIRDDLEIWINRTFKDEMVRRGVKRVALLANTEIEAIKMNDKAKVKEIEFHKDKVYSCLIFLNKKEAKIQWGGESLLYNTFWKLFFNNTKRRGLHGSLGILMAGGSPTSEVSKESCEFN